VLSPYGLERDVDMINELLIMFGGYTVAVLSLGWLTKALISQFLKKDADKQKVVLEAGLAKILHRLSALHDKRIELIPELYYHLERLLAYAQIIHNAQKRQLLVKDIYFEEVTTVANQLLISNMRTKLYLDK
jgi:hypothetical protein